MKRRLEKIALMGLLVWFSALDAIPDEATILNNVVGSEGAYLQIRISELLGFWAASRA
jgi:hypothetical protein